MKQYPSVTGHLVWAQQHAALFFRTFVNTLSTTLSASQVQIQPLLEKEMEVDEFEYNFSATEKPNVRNDTVTLHKRFARDHKVSE